MTDKQIFVKDINVSRKEQIIIDGVDAKNCKGIDLGLFPLAKCKFLKFKTSDGGIAGIWCSDHTNCYFKQLARKTQECEEIKEEYEALKLENKELYRILADLKKERKLKDKYKQECEELKKEIINKNEKIKELRFSVSDLTNRLCYLNAEKSFRIVDLEQTLDEIEKELKEDIYCENQECGCDDFAECLKCTKEHILDIINKAKDTTNEL